MKFNLRHARDVATPSACLLADRLAPTVTGPARIKLVKVLTRHMVCTLRAYAEFHPAGVPRPSRTQPACGRVHHEENEPC
jgi:hypothetical protein